MTRDQHFATARRRHGPNCYYCGAPAQTFDHLRPRKRGGRDTHRNLVPACGICNSIKGERTIEEMRTRLLQRMLGWPKFSDTQLQWLRARGLNMTELDQATLAFERDPDALRQSKI